MIKITLKQLKQSNACQEGLDWFVKKKLETLKSIVTALLKDRHSDWASWLLIRLMTHPQRIRFAIYCAEQVLEIFEKKYPTDKRPQLAIQAAKNFLVGKITANAANAAYAANAAAHAAASAAYAANAAYAAASAAATTKTRLINKIVKYGLTLLGE